MRTGANTVNQTLTPEAASVLKQSLTLARRRGHSQVTPLHVASTLLTSSKSNLFRRACLKSHPFPGLSRQISHPSLHCRALELCFNVALNRLPTNPNPLFQPQPSLSNALVAALKRAQAHQRRGCAEQQNQQNQPFLAVKVELEQLVVSILDDPSVSRVMREAGLSSVAVKNNIEDDSSVASPVFYGSSSVGVFSSPCSPSSSENNQGTLSPKPTNKFWQSNLLSHSFEQNPFFRFPKSSIITTDPACSGKEDVKLVIELLLGKKNNKRKNTVIVGDSVSVTEGIVAELMGRIERGDVPDELKQTHLIKFQFSPVGLNFMKKENVEAQVKELRRKVDSLITCWGGKGVMICLGDLNWAIGCNNGPGNGASSSNHSVVDHLVEEIGRLVSDYYTSRAKVWILSTASYQTYMRCQMRQPPLDVQWALQAVSVPSGGLGLTLHASSILDSKMASHQALDIKPFSGKEAEVEEEEEEVEEKPKFCGECACNYEKEAKAFISAQHRLLPPWLQPLGDNGNQKEELVGLRRKWNRFCQTLHQNKINAVQNYTCSSVSPYAWKAGQNSCVYPDSMASISFADSNLRRSSQTSSSVAKFRRQNSCIIEFNFGYERESLKDHRFDYEPRLDGFKKIEGEETKIILALGPSPLPSDSERSDEEDYEGTQKMSELSNDIHENLPWQVEVLPSIIGFLSDSLQKKGDTWMLVSGNDTAGKRRLAFTIAKSLFGSVDNLLQINLRDRTTARSNDCCDQMLRSALKEHENFVVLVERADLADAQSMKFLIDRFENQKFGKLDGHRTKKGQVIFILTRDDDSMDDEDEYIENKPFVIPMVLKCWRSKSSVIKSGLDHKRKSEFDSPRATKLKNPKTGEKNEEGGNSSSSSNSGSSVACDVSNIKKEFLRQLSFNTALDLNLKAAGDEEEDIKPNKTTNQFLDSIQNHFNFQIRNEQLRNFFSTKIKNSSKAILGEQERFSFCMEEKAIEKLHHACGFFHNSVFEEWLKEVFQTGLLTVKNGGEEGIGVIKLSLGGIDVIDEVVVYEDGFMGTCLPKKIHVSYVD